MNRNGQTSPTEGVRNGVSGLLHDVTSLAELQFELLKVDAATASRKAAVPAVLIGSAVVLGLSTIPLVLLAIAQVFRDQAGWPPALATLTAVLIGLVLAGVVGTLGYFGIRRAVEPLDRSRDELNRNIAWLKNALRRHSAGPAGGAYDHTGYPVAPR
jgi:uncharacterized integral membrane protein